MPALKDLYEKAASFGFLTVEEGVELYHHAPLSDLMFIADELRKKQVPHGKVTWQIDRNLNTTNVCVANCKFCNFYRIRNNRTSSRTSSWSYWYSLSLSIMYVIPYYQKIVNIAHFLDYA